MSQQFSNHNESELNNLGTAIMGFSMGALAIGGIWFAINFIWEIITMVS